MSVDQTAVESFEREIDSISQVITEAFDTLKTKKAPVLNGLAGRIDALCDRVGRLDAPTAKFLQPLIAGVIRSLDELAVELEHYQAGLGKGEAIP
ncbi:MAG: hypothetical protein KDI90_01430 [Alphaproteobacteria bacterium]|nr:hypothetical protein [Alphaproteobacteria bacterium]MCB9974079.1 hypothetical protein [Rhodospirillales bacterium]